MGNYAKIHKHQNDKRSKIESEVGAKTAATDGAIDATRTSLKAGIKETMSPLTTEIN